MSLLSDFFLASASELNKEELYQAPSHKFMTVQTRGIDPYLVAILGSLITGDDVDRILPQLDPIFDFGENGPWIIEIPKRMLVALQDLSIETIRYYSEQWTLSEEWKDRMKNQETAQHLLQNLHDLAERATEQNKNLYVWLCL